MTVPPTEATAAGATEGRPAAAAAKRRQPEARRPGRPRRATQAKSSLEHAPEVVRAAAHLFYVRGYDSTSVADVAEATGLLKGSLYYYIRAKEDLLHAIVQQASDTMMALVQEVRQASADPVTQRLQYFLRRHMEVLIRDREIYGVVLQDYSALKGRRRKESTDTRNEYALQLQNLIEEGQREGVIPADLNPRLTCLAVLGMMNWTYKWYRPNDGLSKSEIIEGQVDLALRTLGMRPAWPES